MASRPPIAPGDRNPLSTSRLVVAAFLVTALTLFIFVPALLNDFVNWDDDSYVYENSDIQRLDLNFVRWSFAFHVGNWHPLTWFSHALDYALWGLNPAGHHLTSIVLHAANAFFVFILAANLIKYASPHEPPLSGRDGFPAKSVIAGAATSLLFGVHPLHVESVAWVAERKDVLSAFFSLLSLIFYSKYAAASGKTRDLPPYAASLIFFIAALMSKPMAVTLPAVMVLLDIYPFRRLGPGKGILSEKKIIIEKVPFFLCSFVSAIVTLLAQQAGEAMRSVEMYPLSARAGVAANGLFFYLGKTIFPAGLYPFYPYPKGMTFLSREFLIPLLSVTIVSLACAWTWRKGRRVFAVIWVFYLVTLLPVIGIIQIGDQAVADRYSYFASAGPLLLIGIGISTVVEKRYTSRISGYLIKSFVVLAFIVVLFVMSLLTTRQINIWRDSITLWSYELKGYPDLWLAYYNRSIAYAMQGKHREAMRDIKKAISYRPGYAKAYYVRAVNYMAQGDYQKSVDDLDRAVRIDPTFSKALRMREEALKDAGISSKNKREPRTAKGD